MEMSPNAIAIHNANILSVYGLGVAKNLRAMSVGECLASMEFAGEIPRRNGPIPCYQISDDVLLDHATPKRIQSMDRVTQFGYLVSRSLLGDWKLLQELVAPEKCGVWFGTSRGPVQKQLEAVDSLERKRVKPSLAVDIPISATSGIISSLFGVKGPNMTLSATCCSGGFALAEACHALVSGRSDLALVAAAEACVHPVVLSQMQSAGMLTKEDGQPNAGCVPFSPSRTGTTLGEGAASVILTRASFAKEAGLKPTGYILGWDTATDSHSRTLSDHEGNSLSESISRTIKMSGINMDQIDLVSPHGTGTVYNDEVETLALKRLFSQNTPKVIPTKHYTGHCLGATSLMEIVLLLEMLKSKSYPSLNYLNEAPVWGAALKNADDKINGSGKRFGLSQSLGFWGNIFSMVVESID